ncbi:MAG: DNA translocase FtsK 4TM domain-containing protein [Gammaproteobacteria bacterium]
MAQAKRKKQPLNQQRIELSKVLREGALWILVAIAAYLVISLFSYRPEDPGWSHAGQVSSAGNRGGIVGAWFADVLLFLFGYLAYLLPVMIAYSGWLLIKNKKGEEGSDLHLLLVRWSGFFMTVAAGCGLATLHVRKNMSHLPLDAGGILGDLTGNSMALLLNFTGSTLLLLAILLSGITLFTGISWFQVMDFTGKVTLGFISWAQQQLSTGVQLFSDFSAKRKQAALAEEKTKKIDSVIKRQKKTSPRIEPVIKKVGISDRVERERQVQLFDAPPDTELPPLALLDDAPIHSEGYSESALEALSRLVELKLLDFGIEVTVVAVQPGPIITRFEVVPGTGVKVSQISNLSKDLARAMAAISVRIVDQIPGKDVIGIEIPNESRELIALSEILRSQDFDESTSPLTLALGKDIGGQAAVADLARMPHLLVAGTTGSGKSVAVNAMILSLLYKTLPKDVRLIMIDPKMLELSVYEGIPHLLTPVITDMKEAANALRWCVGEMERRYKLMAALGVRNIGGYNRKVIEASEKESPILDPLYKPEEALDPDAPAPELQPLPFIVVIIDELADLMMVVDKKKVEELIARLAQKARAAGVHLILATQRPSVDVITGLIKANIPTRIAFQVSSKIDSRTILDQSGAEQLLGHGDMLYLPPGSGMPTRVHGAYVDDAEVHRVVQHLKSNSKPDYVESILQTTTDFLPGSGGVSDDEDGESDPLYDDAVRIVTETRRASISGVQRRLKIGYNRAARMIEQMEQSGIVSSQQTNGNREVLAPPPPEL